MRFRSMTIAAVGLSDVAPAPNSCMTRRIASTAATAASKGALSRGPSSVARKVSANRVQGIAENRPQLGRQLKGNRFAPDHARKNLSQVAHVKGDVLQGREVLIVNNKISAVETSARVTLTTLVGVLHSRPHVSGRVGECAAPGRPEFTLGRPTLDLGHADIAEVRGEGASKTGQPIDSRADGKRRQN